MVFDYKTEYTDLDELLTHYNEGRRKTLFNTAVYLLPLEDLQTIMATLGSQPELDKQTVKAQALVAVELLQKTADRHGISLKLRKKPKRSNRMTTLLTLG